MSKAMIVVPPRPVKRPVLPPVELTQAEVTALVRAFIEGKQQILEDDVLAFIKWCTAQRMGAMLVQMILDGDLRPSVDEGEIKVELREQPVVGRRN